MRTFNETTVISGSFVQSEKHLTKSTKFQHVKPEHVATVLKSRGFNLVALKTGHARKADRVDHQTTIARYRSERDFKINGLSLDIVFKIPHLYGAIEAFLGTYRQVCSNGLVVGEKFTSMRIKHLGNPIAEIETLIPQLVAQEQLLVETIQAMQNIQLTRAEMREFSQTVLKLRIHEDTETVQTVVPPEVLLTPRRIEDQASDLFTVFNRIQENTLRHRMPYVRVSLGADGVTRYRNMSTRPLRESSVKALDINRKIWDTATSYIRKVG